MYNNYLLTNNVVLKKALYICTIYVFNFRTKAKKGHVKGGGGNNYRNYASNGGAIIHV